MDLTDAPHTGATDSAASGTHASVLSVQGLQVDFATPEGRLRAVDDVSLDIRQGETLGVVGESGSGKSVTFLSVMGMVRRPGRITGGSIRLDGRDLAGLDPEALRRLRGREISMVFQDPQTSLNPVFPIGRQLVDVIRAHTDMSPAAARQRAIEVLDQVQIPEARRRFDAYPHQFSGGMRQRVMIAMALVLRPRFIIADEPTTALDVTMQAQVLDLLHQLKREVNVGLVLITHDLGVVARSADRVAVMYGGRVVEEGATETIFARPRHPYTMSLMRAMPRIDTAREARLFAIPGAPPNLARRPPGCAFHPRCFRAEGRAPCRSAVPALQPLAGTPQHRAACHFADETGQPGDRAAPVPAGGGRSADPAHAGTDGPGTAPPMLSVAELRTHFPVRGFHLPWRRPVVRAVDGVSFDIAEGETVGLVGESGCGKSTLGRTLIRLNDPTSGSVRFRGQDMSRLGQRALRAFRTEIQMVFQDPYASLDPRMTVRQILREPFEAHGRVEAGTAGRLGDLMARVGLDPQHLDRRPHEFSGGQRQRIGIARALALSPRLLILDEPVSALDVSVQAQIINLLRDLQAELGLTYVFIAHDLSVVRHICDRVMVMYLGRIVEHSPGPGLFAAPGHPYSQALLSAVPIPDPTRERHRSRIVLPGSVPSPIDPPRGCHFHPRCPRAAALGGALPASELGRDATGRPLPRACLERYPGLATMPGGRAQACHFPEAGTPPADSQRGA